MSNRAHLSALAQPLVENLKNHADRYRVKVTRHPSGIDIVDAGIDCPGGLEAGRLISEICLGGMGSVAINRASTFKRWCWHLDVHTSDPVIACLGSQYAGWSLNHGEGKEAFFALASGPARAIGSREPLFDELAYRNPAAATSLVLEVDREPPREVIEKILDYCNIEPSQLTLILTPTQSLAGGVQIVARVLEVALHKAHELEFPLDNILDGIGTAPVPPPHPNFVKAMGRTNDAILFGGIVHLFVNGDDETAAALARDLPSSASKDFGKPFATVFKEYDYDFYKVDPMLFSPALCTVTNSATGKTFSGGELREDLLELSFNP